MPETVSAEAEKFAASFSEEWSKRLSFRFPLAFVEDLAVRVHEALHVPILGSVNGKVVDLSKPLESQNN